MLVHVLFEYLASLGDERGRPARIRRENGTSVATERSRSGSDWPAGRNEPCAGVDSYSPGLPYRHPLEQIARMYR